MDRLGDHGLEQLTAELAWIRRLALALVRDPDLADDVTQDTWLAARDHVPTDRPLRPWLWRVLLNVTRMRARTNARRTAREAAQPEAAPVPTADELVDRVELQRELADAVLALDEPYRSTVLLHFFEGLSSAEIAKRLGLPDGTVRRRLKIALDRLRSHFATRDRRGLFALAPLAGAPTPATAPGPSLALTLGRFTMKKLIAGVVLVAVVVLGSLWWSQRDKAADNAEGPKATSAGAAGKPAAASMAAIPERGWPWFAERRIPGRKIAGKVLFQGAPFAGATVRLGALAADGSGRVRGDELAKVVSGPDGTFDLGTQPGAVFVVSGEATDKTPVSVVIASADPTSKPDALVLELGACRSRLFGTIVDSSGGGVPRARLRVEGLGGTDAGAKGEYTLCVPMGDSRVRIGADGYGTLDLPLHLVGALERDFELVPEGALAGSVVDERGQPVAFARVLAIPQAVEQPHFLGDGSTIADAEGHFRIANLAPGRFLLAAIAEGFGTSAPKSAIAAVGTAGEITLVVAARATISGTVVANGVPVAGARIGVAGPQLLARSSYSQADGSFVLEGVPFGTTRLLAGAFEVIKPKSIVVDKAALDGVVIEVAEMATLTGRVLRKGAPVADALVQTGFGAQTRSESSGRYVLRGLPPGEVQVTAQLFGSTINAFSPFTAVKLAANASTEHDIELTGAAEVHGVVVDESGTPVPNVYVRLIDPKGDLGESMTDAKGTFVCTSMLGGGDYRAAVFPSPGARTAFPPASGTTYAAIPIRDGDTLLRDVKIAIKHEALSIAGRVVDEAGAPVADVHVEAIGRGFGGNPSMLPSVRADVGGAFVIRDLARGPYTLHAHAGDGSEVELADIAAGSSNVELHLIRPGSIEGRIVGFKTTPRVHARQLTATLQLGNEAVIEGDKFTITGLAPGKWVVEALAGDENDGESVVVKAGAPTVVTLESRGKGTVDGTLTEFGGSTPIKGMQCAAAQSMGGQSGDLSQTPPTAGSTTDERGVFKIPAPIGKARVVCFSLDGTFSVAGGDTDVTAAAPGKIALQAVRAVPPPSEPGFRIKPLTVPLVIASVDPSGPAKAAGLQAGDRVVTIDGASVAGLLPGGAMMLAWNHRPGTTVTVGIERNGAPQSIKIPVTAPTN